MTTELRNAICDVIILARTIKDNPIFDETCRAAACRVLEQAEGEIYFGSGWAFRLLRGFAAA